MNNMQKIVIINDKNNEMLSIIVNDEWAFYGNYWDFNRPEDIISLLKKINGIELVVKEK
jgi:hypothetical protein